MGLNDLFAVTVGKYRLLCGLESAVVAYERYSSKALLVDDLISDTGACLKRCFLAVEPDKHERPILVLSALYEPHGSVYPAALLIPENDILFVGFGETLLAYNLEKPSRLWRDRNDTGFWSWERHGDFVLMAAELEFAAWDIYGKKLWSTFVEPPWDFSVKDNIVHLDVMGEISNFSIAVGPENRRNA